jgi:hypothetical protein
MCSVLIWGVGMPWFKRRNANKGLRERNKPQVIQPVPAPELVAHEKDGDVGYEAKVNVEGMKFLFYLFVKISFSIYPTIIITLLPLLLFLLSSFSINFIYIFFR